MYHGSSLLLCPGHQLHRLFDRHLWVETVDVVEINVVDAHLLKTVLEAFAEELGAVVGRDFPLASVVD
jgi:hypothetical protein